MRVTKIIREYVEETVNGIYDPIIGNCSKDYSSKKNEVEDILEKLPPDFIEEIVKTRTERQLENENLFCVRDF